MHLDADGRLDGYVTYKAVGPDEDDRTLEVVDLVAATADAYLGLWGFLGAVDLASTVTWDMAPVDDPLTWALRDPRVTTALVGASSVAQLEANLAGGTGAPLTDAELTAIDAFASNRLASRPSSPVEAPIRRNVTPELRASHAASSTAAQS